MTTFFINISQDLLPVLAHSLWQAIVIAFVVSMILRRLSARRSNLRYLVSCAGLLMVIAAALGTWSILRLEAVPGGVEPQSKTAVTVAASEPIPAAAPSTQQTDNSPISTSSSNLSWRDSLNSNRVAPWLIAVWAAGVIIMMLRAIRGFAEVRHWLNVQDGSFESQLGKLQEVLAELCQPLGIRRPVRLVATAAVNTPAVIGNWWPVIVLPASMLSGTTLSKEQWKVVLAHELAHVRRFDGLVNLAQLMIESLLFFNPAVWWISRQIRVEREACCDAVAARLTGKPTAVAATLLNVAESLTVPNAIPAMSFAEPAKSGSLRDRVTRLAKPDSIPRTGLTWIGLAASLLILAAAAFALQQGTDVAVRSAAALLSNEERVNELARLQAENADLIAPPADGNEDAEFVAGQSIPVTVRLRTEGGELVPKGVWLYNAQSASMGTLAGVHKPVEVFEHTESFRPGRLRIGAFAAGYAPAISEIVRLKANDPPRTIELTLGRGYETSIAVTTLEGDLVNDVEIRMQGLLKLDGSSTGPNTEQQSVTVTDGVLHLPGVSRNTVYDFTVLSPGWEFERREFSFDTADGQTWKINRAKPTMLQLIDDVTSEPVVGGSVLLAGWTDRTMRGESGLKYGDLRQLDTAGYQLLGNSDEQGRVSINRLSRRLKHTLAIRAEGYRLESLWSVRSGVDLGAIRLKPPITLSGQITGDLSRLAQRNRNGKETSWLSYRNPIRTGGGSTYSGLYSASVADDGQFEISDLIPGTLMLDLPGGQQKLQITESVSGLEFHIARPGEQESPLTREVIVKLTGLPDDLVVRGKMWLWWGNEPVGNEQVTIQENQARVEVPIGCRFNISRTEGLVGCVVERSKPVLVTDGDGPLIVDLPAVPAGAVHGSVLRSDGQAPSKVFVSIHALRNDPSAQKLQINPSSTSTDGLDSWFRSLPYGDTYCVSVREVSSEQYSWAVSDAFAVSADNPVRQIDLTLHPPQRFQVRLIDKNRQPVPNAPVTLNIDHTFGGHSHGHPVNRISDDNGLADFGLVAMDGDAGPADVTVRLLIAPVNGLRGQVLEIDEAEKTVTVTLEPGVKASGIVIDDASGQPIPNAPVRVYPHHYDQSKYFHNIPTKTDDQGRFEFSGLEPIEYVGHVDGATDPQAVVTPSPGGGNRMAYPKGHQRLLLNPEQTPVEWRVQILPGSKLKPLGIE